MKKILIALLLQITFSTTVLAENIPIKITPAQKISTCYNEIQVGDYVKFKVVNDIYLNNKLYIEKNSTVIGIVDFLNDNGWVADNAQIDFKTFKTRDTANKPITIESPLSINGFETLKYKSNRKAQFFNYCGVIWRGKEIQTDPEKETIIFNIWMREVKN